MSLRLGLCGFAMIPGLMAQPAPERMKSTEKLADHLSVLHVPGLSVAVIHEGKIEWALGFGVARVGGPAVTPDTLFQAGSISKPVTAMAVMHLVQTGQLDLDVDVNQYLKSWKVPESSFTETNKVTLRGLLNHTAGISINGFSGYASDLPVPTLLQVLKGEKPANSGPIRVETVLGSAWKYSGGGYVVIQQLLEDVTGQSFPNLMRNIVFKPIGMNHSSFEQPLPQGRQGEAAMPYSGNGEAVRGGPHIYPEMAPAGLWTTASDLALFAMEMQRALAGAPDRVLSSATAREVLTPGLNRWGLGLQIGGSAEHPYFTHEGASVGFQSILVAYENGDGVAVMTNSDNGAGLAGQILNALADDYSWPDFQQILVSKRFSDQTPDPRSAELLRRLIDSVRDGQPDYDQLSPSFAETMRQRQTVLKGAMMRLGLIKSVTLKSVDQVGGDIYRVQFENGTWECRIFIGLGEKIESFGMRQE